MIINNIILTEKSSFKNLLDNKRNQCYNHIVLQDCFCILYYYTNCLYKIFAKKDGVVKSDQNIYEEDK